MGAAAGGGASLTWGGGNGVAGTEGAATAPSLGVRSGSGRTGNGSFLIFSAMR
jgi:hypothetical protein